MSSLSFLRRMSLSKVKKHSSKVSVTSIPSDVAIPPLDDVTVQETASEPLFAPTTQRVLLLHAARQPYELVHDYPVPEVQGDDEVLVRTQAIGLNPIDWKAPDFNFAIPTLPYISGRELSGTVIHPPASPSRLSPRDRVLVISTDYRDLRKAAYQEYVVAFHYNTVRLPPSISPESGSTLGVAFVAAALALGVCMGVDFSPFYAGPDLYALLRDIPSGSIAPDIREECLHSIPAHERAQTGDWIAVWGGSSTSANLTIQLAKLAGLKVVSVVDKAKHGVRLTGHRAIAADLLVDSYDPDRAVDVMRGNLGGKLRFGVDTRGRESAGALLKALGTGGLVKGKGEGLSPPPSPPSTPREETRLGAHLIGLTGLPKGSAPEGVLFHTVPIKLFHEVPEVGEALCAWLERLLEVEAVVPPEIIDVEQGLESVNRGLDRMRKGEISGGKLVVRI
ncbi:chaperonin 10-like protein [Podospora aff. communis PSN243]|uniref:Chaperonin 10-like protein n=1 Tax=Podospora aff. communis PSN243 TaxID=3040156 RepID=A0AAV9GB65_9PEZI|nr:chaperonin 10-like protein [Podospora aff. communis PSN243]